MWQISYTLSWVLGKPNRLGLCKIYLRYKTEKDDWLLFDHVIRVERHQLNTKDIKAPVKDHHLEETYNSKLNGFRLEVETRISKATVEPTQDYLSGKVSSSDRFVDFIEDFVSAQRKINANSDKITSRGKKRAKGRLSDGRLDIYKVILGKIIAFDKKATFKNITKDWLTRFEEYLISTPIGENTLSSNMSVVKALVGHAAEAKLLPKAQYEGYQPPEYVEDIPVFLEEHEIEQFHNMTAGISDHNLRTSGYYFLLACYAGYRISDLKTFNYDERVKADYIVLRAKKNGNIVSIATYGRLPEVLEYCRENALIVTEQTMRKHVRLICMLIGIRNRNVTPHSGRHSFAMRLTDRGLSLDDVAELLGDSIAVARRYARIRNVPLANRVKKALDD